MKSHWISRGILTIATVIMFLAASPDAFASKEKFVRDKPHVTVDEEDKDKVENKARKQKKEVKKVDAAEDQKPRSKKKPKSQSVPESGK